MIRASVGKKNIDCFVAIESWLSSNHSDELLAIDVFYLFVMIASIVLVVVS